MSTASFLGWHEIADGSADRHDGALVTIRGWPATVGERVTATYCLLAPEPVCCVGCLPSDPAACIEVLAARPVPLAAGALTLRGRLRRLNGDALGWRYQIVDAEVVACGATAHRLTRRAVFAAPLVCLPLAAAAQDAPVAVSDDPVRLDRARTLLAAHATIDAHSHGGGVLRVRGAGGHAPFVPLAGPMREGGLAVVCLAIVSDSPTHRVTLEGRIRPFRDAAPGELAAYAERGFARLHALGREQGLRIVGGAADLAAARSAAPSVLVAAEGGDFLEGDAARLEDAYRRHTLRHLQLTHYRPNELGDIQTEPPVHGGLTAFGAEIVRRCNAMGIVVDVAHGTYDLVRQAASVTTKPLVLSHTSLTTRPRPGTRRITPEHARVIAATGGVIGIWPPTSIFADLDSLADGIARMADVVGPAHVAIGTDMLGLVGPSALPDYAVLPHLASRLLARFGEADAMGILGGNYLRVATACLA